MSYDDILEWMGREGTKEPTRERRLRYIEHILTNELLPHMGLTLNPESLRAKACYLGFMVRKLVGTYTGQLQCDDRDHYANKRIDTAGVLMSLLFRQVYRTLLKSFTTQLQRLLENGKLPYTTSAADQPQEDHLAVQVLILDRKLGRATKQHDADRRGANDEPHDYRGCNVQPEADQHPDQP